MTTPRRREAIERAREEARRRKLGDIQPGKMLPLDYLLSVINDPAVAAPRRDRLAIAAAPYCHPRLTEPLKIGKKDRVEEAAATAGGASTEWGSDLEVNQVN
jgi:hypothetical protein